MKNKIVSLIIAVGILLFTGCAGSGADVKPVETKSMRVPSDSLKYYYASGEGENEDVARNRALSSIASRILVTISSDVSSEQMVKRVDNDEHVESQIRSRVDAKAKTIDFTGVSVIDSKEIDGSYHVLVRVDREVLFKSYNKKLKEQDEKLRLEFKRYSKSALFSKLKMSDSIKDMIIDAQATITILRAMNPNFDDKAYQQRYATYHEKLKTTLASAVFSIKSDKNSKGLENLIRDSLSAENIKTSTNNANVKLSIKTSYQIKKYKSANSKLAKLKFVIRSTSLKVRDNRGRVISNNIVKTKAAAPTVDDALTQTKQYEKLIKESGIINFIAGK
jgi:hypothetical protein